MSDVYHLDYETYSGADIKDVGSFKYAEHPTTEILVLAIAKNDGEPVAWHALEPDKKDALVMLETACAERAPIYAHNVYFEHPVSLNVLPRQFGIPGDLLGQWRCTQAMCRLAGIPESLEKAGDFLLMDLDKDKEGKRLIKKFSCPRIPTKSNPATRIFPQDDPIDFMRFVDYCRRDVQVEQELQRALSMFEMTGETLRTFQLDLAMNSRGLPLNMAALRHTQAMLDDYEAELSGKFTDLTGLSHTQRERVLHWARGQGYPFKALTSDDVKKFLAAPGDASPECVRALRIRSRVSFAASKKVKKMLAVACDDGHARGQFVVFGATRTHRWTGKALQPQNMKRSTGFTAGAFPFLGMMERGDVATYLGPLQQTVAQSIRHYVGDGNPLLQADYSAVEACGNPWLCGDDATCREFAEGKPKYEMMAATIFNVQVAQVIAEAKAKRGEKRFIGKQTILGCGYQMGWPKFRGTCQSYGFRPPADMVDDFRARWPGLWAEAQTMASMPGTWGRAEMEWPKYPFMRCDNYRGRRRVFAHAFNETGRGLVSNPLNPTAQEFEDMAFDELAWRAVRAWRDSHPVIVQAWRDIDNAAKEAIRTPGRVVVGTPRIRFVFTKKPGFPALVMLLPGGHKLVYPRAQLYHPPEEDPTERNTSIRFWGLPQNKSVWGWCYTYGGKLLENATQAICGKIMGAGAYTAWKQGGYLPYMLVHDEAIAPKLPGQSVDAMMDMLCSLPEWADGFPLNAAGEEIPFYMKT